MPYSIYIPCVAKWVSRDIVYIVGGYSGTGAGGNFVKSTSVFDIATKTFQTAVPVGDLKTARANYGCSIMDQEGKLVGDVLRIYQTIPDLRFKAKKKPMQNC